MTGVPVPELVAPVRAELKARIDKGVDEAGIGRWRRILALVETGEVELRAPTVGVDGAPDDPGEFASIAMADLLTEVQSALRLRVGQCMAASSAGSVGVDGPRTKELSNRIRSLHKLRSLLLRSAVQTSADLPSFDDPPSTVCMDGPGKSSQPTDIAA